MANTDGIGAERDDLAKIWRQRALQYGERCVMNLAHGPGTYETVDTWQKAIVYPWLREALEGNERTVLDFGCGPGRLTGDLRGFVNGGIAVGYDACEDLLALAKDAVKCATFISDYSVLSSDQYAGYFDIIVINAVMGGFSEALCVDTARLLTTRLSQKGLLFLVENTAESVRGSEFWAFRPVCWYQQLFGAVDLKLLWKYSDLGNEFSVMAGRKKLEHFHV